MKLPILSRLASAVVVVYGVCTLVFALVHLVPGDPVAAMLGENARPADQAALRQTLGLDRPLADQYVSYLNSLIRLDLGESFQFQRPVAELLAERIPATLALSASAFGLALGLAIPLGAVAAYYRGRPIDTGAMSFSLLGAAVPNFWLGPVLIMVFSLHLGWTPVSGRDGPASLILPAVTLGTALAAVLARMVRSSVLEVLEEDYIRSARAKGLSESAVIRKHALRNAWLPILTLVGLQLGGVLSGTVITETIFDWPGIGSMLVEAIHNRDYPVVQAGVLVIGLTYVAVNTLTDLLYAWVDPRVRFG